MNTAVWGPHMWHFLHSVTFNYPFEPSVVQQERTKYFFNHLECMLPCKYCREHYSRHIKLNPIDDHLKNRKALVEWLIHLHNMVNVSLGKPTMSKQHVLQKYEGEYNRHLPLIEGEVKPVRTNINPHYFLSVIILAIILLYFATK